MGIDVNWFDVFTIMMQQRIEGETGATHLHMVQCENDNLHAFIVF
jgi:hypothetical protein